MWRAFAFLLLGMSPAMAANQVITIDEKVQQALPQAWDNCIKNGGLPCVGLYNFYFAQAKKSEEPDPKAPGPAPAKPSE